MPRLSLALGIFGYLVTRGLPDQTEDANDRGFRGAAPTIIGFSL